MPIIARMSAEPRGRASTAHLDEYPETMGRSSSDPAQQIRPSRSYRERAGTVFETLKKKTMTMELPILPCWDEGDPGLPVFCRGDSPKWWMLFNPKNRWSNDNLLCISFGNVGFKYFDKHRSTWMGFAMWSTLFSIAFTIAGCFALSINMRIVQDVNWFKYRVTNTTSGEQYLVDVGLRSFVYTHNPCTPFGCARRSYVFSETEAGGWPNEFVEHGLKGCRDNAGDAALGALLTCATLLFALSGTISRMRFSSDANIQKALGMITDLFCASVPQFLTLYRVGKDCYFWNKEESLYGDIQATVFVGPGYYCYIICLFGALMRALFHWLTPIPGQGSGCKPELPRGLVELLDEDGDGQLSWDEMKRAYKTILAKRRKLAKDAQERSQAIVESEWNASATNGAMMVKKHVKEDQETSRKLADMNGTSRIASTIGIGPPSFLFGAPPKSGRTSPTNPISEKPAYTRGTPPASPHGTSFDSP